MLLDRGLSVRLEIESVTINVFSGYAQKVDCDK